MKLAIGTVQFGLKYGINNQSGIPSDNDILSVFDCAFANGINTLDTAPLYGDAQSKLGRLADKKFNIITKFSGVEKKDALAKQLQDSLLALQVDSIYGYLAHRPDDLIVHKELWDALLLQKSEGKIQKIGYSLYTTEQLEKLLAFGMIPDIIQLPFSLLDRKFSPFFKQINSFGTEIHVRSAFLQGLYFMNIDKLPTKLHLLRENLQSLKEICDYNQISIGALALNFAVNNPYIDKVVIGVDSVKQLKENIDYINNWDRDIQVDDLINAIEVKTPELLNPVNW